MSCQDAIVEKTHRMTRVYTAIAFFDMPRGAVIEAVLDVIVDPLSDAELEALGSDAVALGAGNVTDWVINDAIFTDRDGSAYPIGTCMQGPISGGNNGYTYTVRLLYARDDDPGPHEATFLVRIKDEV